MSNPARRIVNTQNARHSTGPRTPEGKAQSAMNALKHGAYATTAPLPGEDAEEWQALLDGFVLRWDPFDAVEADMVRELAQLRWRLRRLGRIETALLDGLEGGGAAGDDTVGDALLQWERLSRIEHRLRRDYDLAVEQLTAAQARRERVVNTAEKARRQADWQAAHDWPLSPEAYLALCRAGDAPPESLADRLVPRPTSPQLNDIRTAEMLVRCGVRMDTPAATGDTPLL